MDTSTNTERQMKNGQELKDYHAYMEWLNANDRCDFQDSGERLRTAFLDALKYERANAASPPSLHIGMGEITDQQVNDAVETYADNDPTNGPITVSRRGMRAALHQFANAHTKAVTVDAVVKLAEEWDAYCVVTPADPDGIEDFRARLLKLIQQP